MVSEAELSKHDSSGSGPRIVEVAAGLIFREGRLLIAQRYPDSHLGGLWEFPGGKRESGESFESALVRELQEELGVKVRVDELLESVDHSYLHKRVRICFYRCLLTAGEPQALDCHSLKWVRRSELKDYEFPAADAHLLSRLTTDETLWNR